MTCYKWKLVLIFFLLSLQFLNAQTNSKIDSLEQLLRVLPDDTVKVSVFTKLNSEYASTNPRKGIDYCLQGLPLAKKLNWKKGIAVNYIGLGYSYGVLGVYDTSLFYNDSAIVVAEELGDESRLALVYINRGSTYIELNKLGQAQKDFFTAIKHAERSGNADRLARSFLALGNVNYKQEYWKMAFDNYQSALYHFDSLGNSTMQSIVLMNLGNCSRKMKSYEQAMEFYKKAISIQTENEDMINGMNTYSNIALLYEAMEDTINAIKNYEKALELAIEIDDKEIIAINGSNLGDLYLKAGATVKAGDLLNKSYDAAVASGLLEEQFSTTSVLAQIHEKNKDFQSAYQYLNKAMALNDTMLKARQEKLLTEMQTKYETEKKEKENVLLKNENDLQQQKIQSRNYMLALSVIGLILLAITVFFIRKNYVNEKRNVVILDNLNRELTSHRDEILTINRLLQLKVLRTQMNPHFIYNCLNAINNLVVNGEKEKASGYLLNFSKLTRMILDFSDKTLVELEDEVAFIQLYLSLEAMRMGDNFTYDVAVSPELLEDDIRIPSLLVQPFIENAIWHGLSNKSGEKNIHVSFEETADKNRLKCIVEDNGIGRQKAGELKQNQNSVRHESKGIKITQERLELLQYQMKQEMAVQIHDKVDSQQVAGGTRVELLLPI